MTRSIYQHCKELFNNPSERRRSITVPYSEVGIYCEAFARLGAPIRPLGGWTWGNSCVELHTGSSDCELPVDLLKAAPVMRWHESPVYAYSCGEARDMILAAIAEEHEDIAKALQDKAYDEVRDMADMIVKSLEVIEHLLIPEHDPKPIEEFLT